MLYAKKIEMWYVSCTSFPAALPLPNVQFNPSTFAMTGQPYSLTCTVQVVQYLAAILDVTWLAPDGSTLQNVNGITLKEAVRIDNITSLSFTVDKLAQSHAGNYTCQACISIDKTAIAGHCGQVIAEVTLSGKINYIIPVQDCRHTSLGQNCNVSTIWTSNRIDHLNPLVHFW